MDQQQLLNLLRQVREGSVEPEKAMLTLRMEPFEEDLGYAKIDRHRALRQGVAEVIYGAGKTPEQIEGILLRMRQGGQNRVLVTRLTPESAARLEHIDGFQYYPQPRLAVVGGLPDPDPGTGKIVVATGGTSDLPVAEEAALTAETLGNQVERMYDVGVARPAPASLPGRPADGSQSGDSGGGNGGRPGQRGGRSGGLPRHRRSHQRGIRR